MSINGSNGRAREIEIDGASLTIPESGGTNRSALHWDMICDLRTGSEVYADDELVYRDGRFLNGLG